MRLWIKVDVCRANENPGAKKRTGNFSLMGTKSVIMLLAKHTFWHFIGKLTAVSRELVFCMSLKLIVSAKFLLSLKILHAKK
jgi:hypothetical protein